MKKLLLVGLLVNCSQFTLIAMQENVLERDISIACCMYGLGNALVVSGIFIQKASEEKFKENPTDPTGHLLKGCGIVSLVLGGGLIGAALYQTISNQNDQEQQNDSIVRLHRNRRIFQSHILSVKPFRSDYMKH